MTTDLTQQQIINAAIQLVPIHTKEHPYEWVDKVIEIIQRSGLVYEVGPFSTSVEGSYKQVKALLDAINNFLLENNCPEWLLNVQYQFRSEGDVTAAEKTDKHRGNF
jgi:uncharacterized protein YqgV (UPF0045/DUF77 family)